MIEIYDSNVWYTKKRKHFKIKRVFVFFVIIAIVIGIYVYYQNVISEQVLKICSDYSEVCATESVNDAIIQTLKEEIKYDYLVTIEKNSTGEVVLMTANSYKINAISREISDLSLKNLEKKLKKGVPVPILSFSGIKLLSGYGSIVNYKAVYVSNVICEFSSRFESVGINQTLHSIYIDVITDVKLEMPAKKLEKECVTSVLICEAVIVGKVPEVYLGGKLF